jgi:hypothetical protein
MVDQTLAAELLQPSLVPQLYQKQRMAVGSGGYDYSSATTSGRGRIAGDM